FHSSVRYPDLPSFPTRRSSDLRAMTRNPDTAGLPPQVEMMRGDLTVPETLDACLEGIDTVFLVWVAPPATAAAALERIAKHALRSEERRVGKECRSEGLPEGGG